MAETTTQEVGLSRLKATLEKLKTLDESEFDYSEFIGRFDTEKMCPTIGCVAGYLPLWFSDTPFSYIDIDADDFRSEYVITFNRGSSYRSIKAGLEIYYGCSSSIIEALFFGEYLEDYLAIVTRDTPSLRDIQNRFKIVIYLVENCSISWN